MAITSYQEAKKEFLSGEFNSSGKFFKLNDYSLETGYCELLSGDLDQAKQIFKSLRTQDLRASWGYKLIQFIEGYVSDMPSYFQVRNFLEIDLNLLLLAQKAEYIENIINGADLFYSINHESYKFISRVMLNNDFTEVAYYYLQRAKEKFYVDPEMHLMLANCYLKMNDLKMAKQSLNNCLSILPNYFPAKRLLLKLS